MKAFLRSQHSHIYFFLALALLNLGVYGFGLYDVARSDQLVYLIEVGHRQTWWDSVIGTLDLNRKRVYSPGDEILFRPVLYFLLGNERYFFGHHFWMWQAVGIGLHVWVMWCLFALLRTITQSKWTWLGTAFVSVIYVNAEMVMWHHINGYMIFLACLLICLRYVYQWVYHDVAVSSRSLIFYALSLGVACFTYEIANLYAIFFAVFVLLSSVNLKKKIAVVSLMIPLSYALISAIHFVVTQTQASEAATMVSSFNLWETLKGYGVAVRWWVLSALLPNELELRSYTRTMPRNAVLWWGSVWNWAQPFVFFGSVLLWGGIVACVRGGYQQCVDQARRPWVILTWVMLMSYVLLIVLGRSNSRGLDSSLAVGLYYGYIFWILLAVVVVSCLPKKSEMSFWWMRLMRYVMAVSLVCVTLANTAHTLHITYVKKEELRPVRALTQTVQGFVKEHKHEPDFSFAAPPATSANFEVSWIKHKHDLDRRYTYLEALYPQYYDEQNPKYRTK